MLTLLVAALTVSPPSTVVAGVPWRNSFSDAVKEAKALSRPVLHLQMFGKLNDEFC